MLVTSRWNARLRRGLQASKKVFTVFHGSWSLKKRCVIEEENGRRQRVAETCRTAQASGGTRHGHAVAGLTMNCGPCGMEFSEKETGLFPQSRRDAGTPEREEAERSDAGCGEMGGACPCRFRCGKGKVRRGGTRARQGEARAGGVRPRKREEGEARFRRPA